MDKLSQEKRKWNMSRIKAVNTMPEIILRRLLFKAGLRYRLHYKILGKPDLVFPKQKLAIFIHGCFWHMHGCKNSVLPKSNVEFWTKKLQSNIERDKKVIKELRKKGWKVITSWECKIESNAEKEAEKIIQQFI